MRIRTSSEDPPCASEGVLGRLPGGLERVRGADAWTQHLDVADDALRDDMEVVVAVVLAGVRDVVVADHDDVFVGLLPHDPAGELAQPVRLEVLWDRGP